VLRVEHLDVPRDRLAGRAGRESLQPSDLRGNLNSQGVRRIQPEELARRAVQEHDFSLRIEDDQPLLQCLEHVLQKAFFLNQPRDDLLDFPRLHAVEARYEFF